MGSRLDQNQKPYTEVILSFFEVESPVPFLCQLQAGQKGEFLFQLMNDLFSIGASQSQISAAIPVYEIGRTVRVVVDLCSGLDMELLVFCLCWASLVQASSSMVFV